MKIPLSNPDITEKERKGVLEVLNTPHLSLGPKLEEFEQKFARYIGVRYAVAVNSGTSGLHLCVRAIGIKEGDLVITTPFSFISSANCTLFERAKSIFVDIDEKTLNIDVDKIEHCIEKLKKENSEVKAVLPVHVFGRPCEMDDIMSVAREYKVKVIEDAAEATGAEYLSNREREKEWKKVGTFGDCGVFAFYPNKQMTTGEGGMVVTDDEEIYKLCRGLRNQGRSETNAWLQHERLGYNYRLSDINCALGIAQLERLDEILAKREKVAKLYNERLEGVEELILPQFEKNKKISWFVYVVRLQDKYSKEDRDKILEKLKQKGIGCSNYFTPIHLQPFYRKMFGYKIGDFPVTEKVSERTIALPFYNNLKKEQIDYVCENLITIIRSL
jgi:perosamine synthetase